MKPNARSRGPGARATMFVTHLCGNSALDWLEFAFTKQRMMVVVMSILSLVWKQEMALAQPLVFR
jgi:hypothetical protein